jgi:hypothetical protein
MRRIAFLAEAPAGEEVDAGRALALPAPLSLVGPSGRLFAQMLRSAGLARVDDPPAGWGVEYDAIGVRRLMWERSGHWVGNVWPARLENDDFAVLFGSAAVARGEGWAEPEWHAAGYGWLRPEFRPALAVLALELVAFQPDVVVTFGAAATWALTGETAVRECSGTRMMANRVVPGTPVYPTLHPAHVLQDFRMLNRVVDDIRKASEGIEAAPRNLWLEPDIADMERWWNEIGRDAPLLAVDIETTRGQVECVGFAARDGAICVPLVDWRSPTRSYWPHVGAELKAWNQIAAWLASPNPKVMQNGLYDVAWLWGQMGLPVVNYCHDTRLMAHVLDPEMPKSLAYLGATYAVPPGPWKLLRHGEEKRDA